MSHPISTAFDTFRASSKDTFDATGLDAPKSADYYLSNRLEKAFKAGVDAGEQIERERLKSKLNQLLFP